MRTVPRTRHYLPPGALTLCRPMLAFDYAREAYILRGIGQRVGPVLREDRRRRRSSEKSRYKGPERRGSAEADRTPLTPARRPQPTPSAQKLTMPAAQKRRKSAGRKGSTPARQTRSASARQSRSGRSKNTPG